MDEQPGAPGGSRRRLLAVASLLAGTLIGCGALAGAELAARLLRPDYLARTRGLHVFSDTLGWKSRSGVSLVKDGKRVSLNARGHRGRELAVPRRDRLTRVVVLGDSIAFGLGVADDETFTSLLDRAPNGLEAANLAVSGYGLDQELLVLLDDGFRYDPDVVVLSLCLANDLAEPMLATSLYDGRMPKPRFRLADGQLELDRASLDLGGLQRVHQWLSDGSVLFNLAQPPRRGAAAGVRDWHERYAEALQDEDAVLRLSRALVLRMAELCRERGVEFVVAAFPDRGAFRGEPQLARRLLASLARHGVRAIDMTPHFRSVGPRFAAVALDGTGHLNALGHQLASEVLEREIRALDRSRVEPASF